MGRIRNWLAERPWALAAFVVYVGAIIASNWLITHVGTPAPGGTHTTPVWFGLVAPSGVWAAAVSFPARDVVQRLGGWQLGLIAIGAGAFVSWLVSSPVVALASGVTYLCSESMDFALYTPLRRRFVLAVFISGLAAIVVDSVLFVVFLHLFTGFPADWGSVKGLIVGKLWVLLVAIPATQALKRRGPAAMAVSA